MRISLEPNDRGHPSAGPAWRVVLHVDVDRLESMNSHDYAAGMELARLLAGRLGLREVLSAPGQSRMRTVWFVERAD